MADVAKYCFAGALAPTPGQLYEDLLALVHPQHSLVVVDQPGTRSTIHVHQWPSWLQRGHARLVRVFFDLVYPVQRRQPVRGECAPHISMTGTC